MLRTFLTPTCEIPSFKYRKVPFQSARLQNCVVPYFVKPVIGRAEVGTEDDVISDRGMFEPLKSSRYFRCSGIFQPTYMVFERNMQPFRRSCSVTLCHPGMPFLKR